MVQYTAVALRVLSLYGTRYRIVPPSIMADLPIWSANERIDSEAVLVSVAAWKQRYPITALTFLGSLFAIVHRQAPNAKEMDLPCPIQVCTEKNCTRCMEEAGGYDFRWMHAAWINMYVALCRPGAWSLVDHRHQSVLVPGFHGERNGSLQLLWFCQETEMDILNPDGKFEEMMLQEMMTTQEEEENADSLRNTA